MLVDAIGDNQSKVTTTTHVYKSAGTYTVTLTLTDAVGTSTTRVFTAQPVSNEGGSKASSSQLATIS